MIDPILNTPSKGKPKNNLSSALCSNISFYLTTIITIRVQQSRTIGIHERNRTTTQVISNNNNIDNGHKKNHGPSIILFPMVLASSLGVRYSLKVLLLLLYTNIEENITVPIAVVLFIPCALPLLCLCRCLCH